MRVFVTVGTHNQGFEYLLKKVAILSSDNELVIQSGYGKFAVENAKTQYAWFTPEEMQQNILWADVVISHLGCGIAREVQELGTPSLFFCRSRQRGEHFDNHQEELKAALSGRVGLSFYDESMDLSKTLNELKGKRPSAPENKVQLVDALKAWLK